MAITWYPETPTGRTWAELSVDDPGHGAIRLHRLDDRYDTDHTYSEHGTFTGRRLVELVDTVTNLALGTDTRPWARITASRGEPVTIEANDAPDLLPVLQRALVLATAGQDRYDHTFPEPAGSSLEPLCVYCNTGSDYSHNITISAWCSEYGHTPYASVPGTTWDTAHERHQRTLAQSADFEQVSDSL